MGKVYKQPSPSNTDADSDGSDDACSDCTEDSTLTSLSQFEEEEQRIADRDIVHSFGISKLTAEEKAAIRTGVQAKIAKQTILDKQSHTLQQQLAGIESIRMDLEETTLRQRALLSKLRAIPHEVLKEIFLAFVEDLGESPWTLMHINRTWRYITLRSHGLWKGIMIAAPIWREIGHSRREEGRELCIGVEQVRRAFQRAGLAPIDLLISAAFPVQAGRNQETIQLSAISDMVSCLNESGRFMQVQDLKVVGGPPYYLREELFDQLNFSRISSLSLERYPPSGLIDKALNCKPTQLRMLRVSCASSPSGDLLSACASIKHLCLENTAFLRPRRTPMPNYLFHLTTLELNQARCIQDDKVKLQFPFLQTLTIHKGKNFWSIKAPLLTTLVINSPIVFGTASEKYNLFLSLHSLTITSLSFTELRKIRAPNLHTLNLRLRCAKSSSSSILRDFKERSVEKGRLNPVVFRLTDSSVLDYPLLELLSAMDRLKILEFVRVPLKKAFFDGLKPKRLEGTDAVQSNSLQATCPTLDELSVDFVGCKVMTDFKNTRKSAQGAMKARSKARFELETASLRFNEEEGWINLLQ